MVLRETAAVTEDFAQTFSLKLNKWFLQARCKWSNCVWVVRHLRNGL
jgi:hypothetical protein